MITIRCSSLLAYYVSKHDPALEPLDQIRVWVSNLLANGGLKNLERHIQWFDSEGCLCRAIETVPCTKVAKYMQ